MIEALIKTIQKLKNKTQKPIQGILAIVEGEPTKLAIAETIKQKIIIMSPKAIRLLAKKMNYPHL